MAENKAVMKARNLVQKALDDLVAIQVTVDNLTGSADEVVADFEQECSNLRDTLNDLDDCLGTLVQSDSQTKDTVDTSMLQIGDVLTLWVHHYNVWCGAVVIKSSPRPRVIVTTEGELKDKILDTWRYNVKSIQRGGICSND